MAQFLKINPMSDNVNGTSLVNLSDAAIIQFDNSDRALLIYGEYSASSGVMSLDGIIPGQPGPSIMLEAFQQAIESNPGGRIIPFPTNIGAVEYFGN